MKTAPAEGAGGLTASISSVTWVSTPGSSAAMAVNHLKNSDIGLADAAAPGQELRLSALHVILSTD